MSEEKNENYTPTPFLGLAPFLRRSLAGENLMPLAQALWVEAAENQNSANAWMNLAVALECVGQNAQAARQTALSLSKLFVRPAAKSPVSMRVLLLMVPGALSVNTPLDCLLEFDDIELLYYFLDPAQPACIQWDSLPKHDLVMVAFGDDPAREHWQKDLASVLEGSPRPVVNKIENILKTRRDMASQLMHDAPGATMSLQFLLPREDVAKMAFGEKALPENLAFPLIIRPIYSQGGKNLEKISDAAALADYLNRIDFKAYFLSNFVDYHAKDGLYRKMRLALIDGVPYPCHMAISKNWMIHYLSSHMENEPEWRLEERAWMENFSEFAKKHESVWAAFRQRIGLDYFCVDCAQMPNGDLLIFEFDHISVVHDMDDPLRFPYKSAAIARIKDALRDFFFEI